MTGTFERIPNRLYVVRSKSGSAEGTTKSDKYSAEHTVWTLSAAPDVVGWRTDGGVHGCGLSRELAHEIADRYNACS